MINLYKQFIIESKIALYFVKINILKEASLRVAFGIQIFGMIINNFSFLIIWIFFFQAFGEINGWSSYEVIGLQGFLALVFGIAFGFFGGVQVLPQRINTGAFDSYLLIPRNLYLRIFVEEINISCFGDIIYGLLLIIVYLIIIKASILQILLFLGLIIPTVLIILNICLVCALVAFYFVDAESIFKNLFEIFFSPSMYPASLYQGVLRFIFLFGIPSLAIAGIPVEIIKNIQIGWFAIIWVIGIFWTIIAYLLLNKIVKKYESGNLLASSRI